MYANKTDLQCSYPKEGYLLIAGIDEEVRTSDDIANYAASDSLSMLKIQTTIIWDL